jgi:hypothetical protein
MYRVDVMLFDMSTKENDIIESHSREDEAAFIQLVTILLNNLPSDYTLCISQDQ